MATITISERPTAEDLRAAHLQLSELRDDEVALRLSESISLQSPLDYGRIVQAILTWGLESRVATLELSGSPASREALVSRLRQSDFFLIACLIAGRVIDPDGNDVSEAIRPLAASIAAERNTFPVATADGLSEGRATVLLPSFILQLNHSPDLHEMTANEWGVEEEARTLYHDIWPEPGKLATLRQPSFALGEHAVGEGEQRHIARREWPIHHPLLGSEQPFRTLAARMMNVGPGARELAESRIQPKPVTDEIGEVLFEITQNTEWHAVRFPAGTSGRNLRLLSFSRCRYSREDIDDLRSSDPTFADYLERVLTLKAGIRFVTIGVASVIDSGIGLARSAAINLSKVDDFSEDTEVRYLTLALGKTLRVSRSSMGNIGLPRVQQLLTNLRGYMYIRTGSVEIRRDFLRTPWDPIDPQTVHRGSQNHRFIDWVPTVAEQMNIGHRVGTDVTFVVPLEYDFDGVEQ